MNCRRELLIALAMSSIVPLCVRAQPAGRVYRIGVLLGSNRATGVSTGVLQPFEQGLRELGYVEGRNLVIEWRGAEGRLERLPALAAELVALKVDLIVAGTSPAAVAAKNSTDAIPIVFVVVADPVGQGLVKSLARPGNNVTGFATLGDAIIGKQLELLREAFPRINRLAVIYNPGDPGNVRQLAASREASAAMKLLTRIHEVRGEAELEAAFRAIEQERPEGLHVIAEPVTFIHRKRIAEFAAAQRLPAVYGAAAYVEAGGLLSYSTSFAEHYRRTAVYVDRILKGAKPADLPVQQPTTLELAVNLKTAKALGITIPQTILLRADRVIE
jgi:putative ABC transport system substrate-binding protein